MSSPILETARLILRPPDSADVILWEQWLTDSETARHVGGVRSPERIVQTFAFVMSNWAEHGFGTMIVTDTDGGDAIGLCGINRVELDGAIERDLGYLVARSHWGRGIATEASRAVMEFARDTIGLTRVTAWPSPHNLSSIRVVEKLGFRLEKTFSKELMGQVHDGMSLYAWTGVPRD